MARVHAHVSDRHLNGKSASNIVSVHRESALFTEQRQRLYELVVQNPASKITDLAVAAGISHQTATYHLRRLQQAGRVTTVLFGNSRHVFAAVPRRTDEEKAFIILQHYQSLTTFLGAYTTGPRTAREVSDILVCNRSSVDYHVKTALAVGFLEPGPPKPAGRAPRPSGKPFGMKESKSFQLTEKGRQLLTTVGGILCPSPHDLPAREPEPPPTACGERTSGTA